MSYIADNVRAILAELPPGVELAAAVKTRTATEIAEAAAAGIRIAGENYVQEAEAHHAAVSADLKWHLIGHLQQNKVKKAVRLFDMIETLDSPSLARAIEHECAAIGKVMPVLIEVNSGREPQKSGVLPEHTETLAKEISQLPHLKLVGLMTMGTATGDARPAFRETRRLFETLQRLHLPHSDIRQLSMGMSNSYREAIEEGANLVRLGTLLFGERTE
ncbi:MAG: YggS family pyridoxal phosphate-dependent enzyme [Dehalococcoidia bacterium]|nr:YggS family pyridoxal phosphate-dependent enzyme [Dehalococcoidia bacterium]